MAKLGTKQRPAIIHVRTQARAEEIFSIFSEHGWQFILGIEPDKPEDITDLTRLLKTTRSDQQMASKKVTKAGSKRKKNAPLRVVQTQKKQAKSSATDMKTAKEAYEYFPNSNALTLHAVVSFSLSVLFFVMFLVSTSLWYVVFLVIPLFYSLSLSCAIFSNQRIILHDNKITILRRMHTPLTATVADALYEIIVKKGVMTRFRFHFYNGRKVAQICPLAYKNADQLIQHLTAIIDQENIDVDVIER